jgi:hypothetical protein
MKKIFKLIALYSAAFLLVFTLNGWLSMTSEHGFFYLTPEKLVIRLVVALLISAQIYIKFPHKFR